MLDSYGESVLIFLGINMVLALSLYLPISAGQLSLGHGGFMAIGAYVTVICTTWLGWPLVAGLAGGGLVAALAGAVVGFPALDLTTFEIRRELVSHPGGPAAAELVSGWLERADLVKFAGYEANADEARQALYDARIFIDRTRARAEPAHSSAEPPAAPTAAAAEGGA